MTRRTIDEVDAKDWIIFRLATIIASTPELYKHPDYRKTCIWLVNQFDFLYSDDELVPLDTLLREVHSYLPEPRYRNPFIGVSKSAIVKEFARKHDLPFLDLPPLSDDDIPPIECCVFSHMQDTNF